MADLKAKLQEIHRIADAVSGWSTLAGTNSENAQRVRTLAREALALLPSAPGPTPTCATCRHLRRVRMPTPAWPQFTVICRNEQTAVLELVDERVNSWGCNRWEPSPSQETETP